MPFKVTGNKNDGYRLYNLDKKTYAKRTFKTREAANNMKRTYMSYDKKKATKKKKSKY
tara:strand:- start:617 stop:790 length:174 start_codon:yes stop_codon:yes gene_type:complete